MNELKRNWFDSVTSH